MTIINPPEESISWQLKQIFNRLIKIIADLKLAIVLLLLIALFSITGTVIEQGQSLEFYQQNYPEDPALFGFLSWKILLSWGLDRVYTTWWYLSLLILFGTSLIACTFKRQLPALKAAKTWKYYQRPTQFEKLALSAELDTGSPQSFAPFLQQKGYRIFQEGGSLYARKGIIGKIGPIIVHIGMIIILLGAMWGAFTGFLAQEMIPSGSIFQVKNIFEAGILSDGQIPKKWAVKVNRFWIEYTTQGAIDQFYSDLSVVDKTGKELKRKTIFVNEPLRYDGVTFYQTSWGIAGARVQLNNSPIFQLPIAQVPTENKTNLWGTWIPTKPDLSEGVSLVVKDLQGTAIVYNQKGELSGAVRIGQSIEVNGINLKLIDLIGSTGLQIKADPGVPIVYTGFALLMAGVVMSYFSHSQIWALQQGDRFYIGGKTNRAQVTFERELIEILDSFKDREIDRMIPNPITTDYLSR
jgi:cytochrome c biogenesis protein